MMHANIRMDEDLFRGVMEAISSSVDEGLNEVANVVLEEAKSSADFIDKTGNLRRSIRKRKSKFEDGGYIVLAKGSNKPADEAGEKDRGYHAHLVEFGHVMIAWGRVTGKRVKPHPFMRNARNSGFRRALAIFRSKSR